MSDLAVAELEVGYDLAGRKLEPACELKAAWVELDHHVGREVDCFGLAGRFIDGRFHVGRAGRLVGRDGHELEVEHPRSERVGCDVVRLVIGFADHNG